MSFRLKSIFGIALCILEVIYIAGHAPIASWRKADSTNFGAIWECAALVLLAKETLHEFI